MASTRSTLVKSLNFHEAEVEQLAKTWIATSTNPIIGCGQTSGQFWLSTTTHFNKSMEAFRRNHPGVVTSTYWTLRSVQSKWTDINHDCAKFSRNFSMINALNESGVTYEQKIEKALKLYKQLHKKANDFKFMSCWDLLKECPKWQPVGTVQAKQTNRRKRSSAPSTVERNENWGVDSSSGGGDAEDHSAPFERPMRNKKAKEMASCEKRGQRHRAGLADATNNIAAAMRDRVGEMRERHETQFFMTDINKLDDHAKDFLHRKWVLAYLRLQEQTRQFHLSRGQSSAGNDGPQNWSEANNNSAPGENIRSDGLTVGNEGDRLGEGLNGNENESTSPEDNNYHVDNTPSERDGYLEATDIYKQWV